MSKSHEDHLKSRIKYTETLITDNLVICDYFKWLSKLQMDNKVSDSVAEDMIKMWIEFDVDNDKFDDLFSNTNGESSGKFIRAMNMHSGFTILQDRGADGLDGDLGLAYLLIFSCVKATLPIKISIREYFMKGKGKPHEFFRMFDDDPIVKLLQAPK